VILYLLSVGFVSILAQVVILRELNVAFFGVELIYILAIAVWLLWTALGALVGRRIRAPSEAAAGYLFVAFALVLPADVAFVRGFRAISGGIPGAYLPFGAQLAGLLVALLPAGVVLGILFQWAARTYIGRTRTLAGAYAIESVGGVFGGLASTLFLKFGIQNFTIAVLCSLASVAAVFAASGSRGRSENRSRRGAGYAGAIVFPVILLLTLESARVDGALTRINYPTLVASRDSPYSRITVTRQGNQFVVFENDALAFETQSAAAEELVHLAAAQTDTVGRVLILGGGVEGTVNEILKYSPRRVDYVELNPVVVSLIENKLPRAYWEPLRSTTVTLTIGDPRRFAENTTPYDLILIGTPDPTSGQTNRFYTVEFFERCRAALARNGVLALRLRSSENVWTPFVTYRNTSIYRALKAVFQDVVVMPGVTNIVVASDAPLHRDPAFLAERLKSRRVPTRLVTPEYVSYLYTNDRFFEIARVLSTTAIPPNTDVRPVCYKYSSMIWLSKFFPKLITADMGSLESSSRGITLALAVATLVLCGVFAACRRRVRFQRVVLAGLAGFVGMVLETVLILHYQVKSGVLYQNLGVLLMVFMAGLGAGSGVVSLLARRPGAGLPPARKTWALVLFGGFSVLNLAFVGALRLELPVGLATVSLLLFIGGFLVSGVFAYASLLGAEDQRTLISPLYAADLLGGCAGSVVGSMLLIPFLGMEQTAGLMAVLSLAALLAV
jgi:spermidine synthase